MKPSFPLRGVHFREVFAAGIVLGACALAGSASETPGVNPGVPPSSSSLREDKDRGAGADSLPAREQARLCVDLKKEPGIAACRRALELGLSPKRAAIVYGVLALHLADANRWGEVVDAYRALVRIRPDDAEVRLRLGDALLYGESLPEEAAASFRQAVRLKPDFAAAHASLGVALNAVGSHREALAALDEARRLDPSLWDRRPALRLVHEASQRGEKWPPSS